jgi:hypothetical protein
MIGWCTRLLAGALAASALLSASPIEQSAARSAQIFVSGAAARLIDAGVAAAAPPDTSGFQEVPSPGVRYLPNVARATNVPWIDSNGWRFARGLRRANYVNVPAGSAALAAAEAFVFNVDAIVNPDPKDVEDLGMMLRFIRSHEAPPMPELVNVGVVDDGSPAMGEVLNLLTRRNLLYRIVTKPDPALDLNVQLATADFPPEAAANPYEFAARVRAKLGDDKRLVRLYGTSTVIARLTGDGARARLSLLSFGNRRSENTGPQAIRVRVVGRYRPVAFTAYGVPNEATLGDLRHPDNTTEFWVPDFRICAVIDLASIK